MHVRSLISRTQWLGVASLCIWKFSEELFQPLCAAASHARSFPKLFYDRTSVQSIQQLWPRGQSLLGFLIRHPLPSSLVLFRPLRGLLLNADLVELEDCLWGLRRDLIGLASVWNLAQILQYLAHYTRFFPGLTTGSFLLSSFIGLPSAFRQYPASSTRRLDQEYFLLVVRQGNHARH